jgi:hypothetical protein
MKTKVCLIPNLDHETRKTKTKTWHVQNKIPTRFYCKEKTKQGYDKKNRTQTNVEQTKGKGEFYFYLYSLDT